jgi:hypothetical protein
MTIQGDGHTELILNESISQLFIYQFFKTTGQHLRFRYWAHIILIAFCFSIGMLWVVESFYYFNSIFVGICLFFAMGVALQSLLYQSLLERSITPILIYDSGMELYITRKDRRNGQKSFIKKDDIEYVKIRICKHGNNYFINRRCRMGGLLEIEVHGRDASIYCSGIKPKETIAKIIEIVNNRWNIRVDFEEI